MNKYKVILPPKFNLEASELIFDADYFMVTETGQIYLYNSNVAIAVFPGDCIVIKFIEKSGCGHVISASGANNILNT